MKKIFLAIYALTVMVLSLQAQDINTVFPNMPHHIIYGLTNELKQELLEQPKDTTVFTGTMIYERIKRKEFNPNFIALQTSDAGRTEIRLLPLINDSKIICVVKTVKSVISDSQISFYTDKWEPIKEGDLFPAKDINWFIKADVDRTSEQFQHAMTALTSQPMAISLSPEEDAVTVNFDPKSFLSTDDYKLIEPFLTKEPKIFRWNKTSFK